MNDEKNVLQFPRKTAVFTPQLRNEITTRITPHIEKPEDVQQIINRTEDAICHWLICGTRSLAKKLGDKLGMTIGNQADAVVRKVNS